MLDVGLELPLKIKFSNRRSVFGNNSSGINVGCLIFDVGLGLPLKIKFSNRRYVFGNNSSEIILDQAYGLPCWIRVFLNRKFIQQYVSQVSVSKIGFTF
jgi:hypothetical protein